MCDSAQHVCELCSESSAPKKNRGFGIGPLEPLESWEKRLGSDTELNAEKKKPWKITEDDGKMTVFSRENK